MEGQKKSRFTPELKDQLTQFIVNELGGKVLDGITYSLIRTDNHSTNYDKQRLDEYQAIRKEASMCGFQAQELFRVYNLQNGVIFDIDMGITKQIAALIVNKMLNENGQPMKHEDIIGNKPENRRKSDMISLAKYLDKQLKSGNSIVEIALFSRNSVPEIVINGQLQDGRYAIQKYKAYAIRFWDLEDVNRNLLIPMGLRIRQVQPGAILPTRTGVLFQLELEKVKCNLRGESETK